MENNQPFLYYGKFEVENIKNILSSNPLDWDTFDLRQKACTDMVHTKTIPIVYDENFFSTNYEPVYTENFHFFEEELSKLSKLILEKTDQNGYLLRAILVKLSKKKNIPSHVDTANESFKYCRRIHVPIVTNPNCFFTVGDTTINMKEGEVWEMNNDKLEHSVENQGDEDRIHLIIDWCEKPLPK